MKKKIAILGLGYVGLTLSLALAKKKFNVVGYDTNSKLIKKLNSYQSYIYEKDLHSILKKTLNKNFTLSDKIPTDANIYIVTVGTPVKKNKTKHKPKLDQIRQICNELTKIIKNKPLIVFRSTLPIGASRNIIEPLFKKKGFLVGKDYYLAFAPERTIEGDAINELSKLPQIISGYDVESTKKCKDFFKKFSSEVIDVKNLESAEIIKLINNSYRDLTFAYANQVAMICNKYNLNANNVIRFSNYNYPRSRIPTASPGVGGPCLTKDPFILNQELARGKKTIFTLGREINEKIISTLLDVIIMKLKKIKTKEKKILLCGLSFKGNPPTKDFRSSSTLKFIKILNKYENFKTFLYDPMFKDDELKKNGFTPGNLNNKHDCIVILNNHKIFKKISLNTMSKILKKNGLIFDYWSILTKKIKNSGMYKFYEIGEK